jgi:hypothetical protein
MYIIEVILSGYCFKDERKIINKNNHCSMMKFILFNFKQDTKRPVIIALR